MHEVVINTGDSRWLWAGLVKVSHLAHYRLRAFSYALCSRILHLQAARLRAALPLGGDR